jgi:hypothetical protein
MSWTALNELPGSSRRTWQRKIAAGELPSKIDPTTGRKLVWADPAPQPSWAVELEAKIDRLLEGQIGLIDQGVTASVTPESTGTVAHVGERSFAQPAPVSPIFAPADANGYDRLLARVEAIQAERNISERQIEREAKLNTFLTHARKGGRRGPRTKRSWAKLRAWADDQGRLAA